MCVCNLTSIFQNVHKIHQGPRVAKIILKNKDGGFIQLGGQAYYKTVVIHYGEK